jgi:DNA-binding MarR family transcriptional regulator/N-acetylglutamate synthase-like GNAT family acetyltransferase
MTAVGSGPTPPIAAVRRFNRFYTKHIGVLREGHLDSPFSLTEVRVMYELAHRDGLTASELARDLALDSGYLSRILRSLERRDLLEKTRSDSDGRQAHLRLTDAGRSAFSGLNSRADDEISALIDRVAADDWRRLTDAMRTIERLLAPSAEAKHSYVIRTHQPGDIGWVVFRHGILYAREYGWDERFEALVAQIVAEFVQNFDPRRERCWIAERDGERVGSVFLVKKTDTIAKLRLLLVEPKARGSGIGHRLVDECIRFARFAKYERITLWTNSVLHAARRIYEQAGFALVNEEPHVLFGSEQTGQNWELQL